MGLIGIIAKLNIICSLLGASQYVKYDCGDTCLCAMIGLTVCMLNCRNAVKEYRLHVCPEV